LKCNTRPLDFIVEHFLGGLKAEASARPCVEAVGDFFQIARECELRSAPFGKYCRTRPFVFSLVGRCHGLCGSQK
jgi:hypothetical protein